MAIGITPDPFSPPKTQEKAVWVWAWAQDYSSYGPGKHVHGFLGLSDLV